MTAPAYGKTRRRWRREMRGRVAHLVLEEWFGDRWFVYPVARCGALVLTATLVRKPRRCKRCVRALRERSRRR